MRTMQLDTTHPPAIAVVPAPSITNQFARLPYLDQYHQQALSIPYHHVPRDPTFRRKP